MNKIRLQLAYQDLFRSSKEKAWHLPSDKNCRHILNPGKKSALSILLFMLIVMFAGCASDKVADVQMEETRRITTIMTSENTAAVNVFVKGNQNLEYTAIRRTAPLGVRVDFPDTGLKNLKPVYTPPENEIISSIELVEIYEDQTEKAQMFIALKADTPYDLDPFEGGVKISFPKVAATVVEEKAEPTTALMNLPAATQLEAVTALSLKNKLVINVKADGVIKDFTSFTLDSPPRIVFDIFNLHSAYETEQKIAVESKWVNRIRHFAHPDKVRLVLDTHQDFLSGYEASPIDDGLIIEVGK
jgi:type IV pilus assembly protein PilQ